MKKFLVLIFACAQVSMAYSQANVQDSAIGISEISFHFGGQAPFGDLSQRFGADAYFGAGYHYKFASNWVIGANGSYIFGNQVKNPLNIFGAIRGANGELIDQNGYIATFLIQERGLLLHADIGHIIPLLGPNKNSGLLLKLGVGYMEHQIWIESRQTSVPQISGHYKAGYDRLTSGLSLNEFIGYQYLSNKKLVNFFIGLDIYQGFTQGRRGYAIDIMNYDNQKRLDGLIGIKAGWMFLIYKRESDQYYYN